MVKFRKAKQIVIALITATLKPLLTVAKTSSRLTGHKFYTGNIYYSFLNILAHISPISIKKVRNRSHAPKNATPSCRQTNLYAERYLHTINGSHIFTKWISFIVYAEMGIVIPQRKLYLSARLFISFGRFIISYFFLFVNTYRKIYSRKCKIRHTPLKACRIIAKL